MCIYIYIINIHSTHIYTVLRKQKLLFWMRLIAINRLTALIGSAQMMASRVLAYRNTSSLMHFLEQVSVFPYNLGKITCFWKTQEIKCFLDRNLFFVFLFLLEKNRN